jgi:type VI protein secretion system component VasF
MRRGSNTIVKMFPIPVKDIRNAVTSIASTIVGEMQQATGAVYDTLTRQRKFATKTLSKASRKAARLSRRYPLQTIAAALVLGFLIGRSRH